MRQPAHTTAMIIVLLALWLASLACSGQFYYPAELTATAKAPKTAISGNAQVVYTLTSIVLPNDPPTPGSSTSTPTPRSYVTPTPAPTKRTTQDPPIMYYTQAGDTLRTVAMRFNVQPEEITSPSKIPQEGLFDPGILLLIPPRLGEVSNHKQLIPDSEVVFSPSALDLDIEKFVKSAGGYLGASYKEYRVNGWNDGGQIIMRVATENSINPRLLLAVLEIQAHWVYGQPRSLSETDYPMGWLKADNAERKGLYFQLSWAVQQLNNGYYGWREGTLTSLTFPNGQSLRLAPDLNAGTVSVLYLFSQLYDQAQWAGILYGPDGIMPVYEKMFGNPFLRAQSVEPLFPATLTQPPLELPWLPGRTWSMTGGPHSAWIKDKARVALDFAPSSTTHGCYESDEWVVASASGLVVRSEPGVVVVDLDGDGHEQTGWDIMYLHIATKDRVALGTFVNLNDPIGHPSCEGGSANGTHVHIARKYNGEWILADGPMPFNLSGWRAHAGEKEYQGTLTKGDQTVTASQVGSFESLVTRPKTTP